MSLPPYYWWRTVFFLIPAISLYTIALGAASLVSSLFESRGHFAHRCARAWSWLILRTTGVDVSVEGGERITPGTTYVFVSNHQSIYDIPVLFASLPYQLRIIAKASLAGFPVLGWHLKRGGHLLVDRRHPNRGILKRWRALVSDGLSLIIFAEGTRSRAPWVRWLSRSDGRRHGSRDRTRQPARTDYAPIAREPRAALRVAGVRLRCARNSRSRSCCGTKLSLRPAARSAFRSSTRSRS